MNYEYCTALNHRNTVVKEMDIDLSPSDGERYLSMFGYDNSIYKHLEITKTEDAPRGTVQGFKGNFFCKYLYFDIDSENLDESLEMARNLCTLLYNMLDVDPRTLFISFSGNKGFHIGLHQSIFGGFAPAKDLPERLKVLAVRILMECFEVSMSDIQQAVKEAKKQVYNHMDIGIYNANRIFRVINSRHRKSELYKIGLTYNELNTLTIEQIKELAKQPRKFAFEVAPSHIKPVEQMQGLWQYALSFDIGGYNANQSHNVRNENGQTFYTPEVGGRNNELFKQAAYIFDKSQFSEHQVLQLVNLINRTSSAPLDYDEVKTLVHSAFKKTLPNRAEKQQQEQTQTREVENFADWFSEWADYYTQTPKPFTCLFDEIDADQEYNMQGKLATFIGKGGTKKSYYALNVIARNILDNGSRAIYSSMEMGKVEMVNRLLDVCFPVEEGMPASKFYRTVVKKDKEGLKNSIRNAAKILNDNLILTHVSKMTTEQYFKFYQRATEIYGPIDMLCVDGLSMMGGTGTESERFERHTMELKAMANETKMFIPLICHTTKDAKQYMRDVSEFVRGSGKILDNCDFTLSFSNLIDTGRSTPENVQYLNGLGHVKYYNKRGTGLMLNKVYDFCGLTKCITPCSAEPYDFPEYDKFVSEYKARERKKTSSKTF